MSDQRPHCVIIAGPNGAGKSTSAPRLLRDFLGIGTFVNADTIARGLSEFDPDSVAVEAGQVMLNRLRDLASRRQDFAFETTLSGRTWVQWLRGLQQEHGYMVLLLYLWLPTSAQAVERVRRRVQAGGHGVPEATVRRRHGRSLRNFFELYEPLVDQWVFFDNSEPREPAPVAFRLLGGTVEVQDTESWDRARSQSNDS